MSEFIDLSHSIEENMFIYPGSPSTELKEYAQIEKDGFKEYLLNISTHTGTHIEVEAHAIRNGKTLNDYGLDRFYGTALAVDCTHNQYIETDLLHESLKDVEIPDFLFLVTGWDKHWGNTDYFKQYPVLSIEAATYLSKLPLKGLGIDAASFDAFDNDQLTIHKILLKKGLILIENLRELKRVIGKIIIFNCFPLKLKNSDSSPVRACAMIKK